MYLISFFLLYSLWDNLSTPQITYLICFFLILNDYLERIDNLEMLIKHQEEQINNLNKKI